MDIRPDTPAYKNPVNFGMQPDTNIIWLDTVYYPARCRILSGVIPNIIQPDTECYPSGYQILFGQIPDIIWPDIWSIRYPVHS
jgi:hypothetical protein